MMRRLLIGLLATEPLLDRARRRSAPGVTVLMYHEVLADGDSVRPAAVLTFDDGGAGNHQHLLPVVEEARVPVTVFVATGHVESGQLYWFDRVVNALQVVEPISLDMRDVGLSV